MAKAEHRIRQFPSTSALPQHGARLGRIVAVDDGKLVVEMPLMSRRPAKLAIQLSAEQIATAIAEQQPAVCVFENGDETLPIVIGLIEEPTARPVSADAQPHDDNTSVALEVDVDGRRTRVTAKDEIVLECGQASITLRRNGRVVIRGTHVESQSEGTNRIKGGQVRIN